MHEEEISLREIIETVWNGKNMIIMVTTIAMLFSGIVSFFVLDPTYEVTTTVMVNEQALDQQSTKKDLSPFAEQIKSNFVINKIMQKLKLDKKDYSVNAIRDSITVEAIKDSTLIRIKVKGNDPQAITAMANVVALELGSFIEISTRLDMIVGFKKRLIEVEDLLVLTKSGLDQATKQLQDTPEKLITQKSLSDDPYLQSVVSDSGKSTNKNLGALQLVSEEINPVYINLKTIIAEASIQLSKLQTEQQSLDERMASNQKVIDDLQKQMDAVSFKSDGFVQSVNRFNAVLITPAMEPDDAVGPKKLLNVALAGVVAGMISVFVVFIREYWRSSSTVNTAGSNISA
jgi:succinoglycan biosynthesis transport protein ExoP